MNKVQEFLNENFGEVRAINKDGEMWFVAKDISDILNYSETNAMTKKIDCDDIKKIASDNLEGANSMAREFTIINESGLYQAVLSITKKDKERYEKARSFKKWITGTVIPTLRKDGMYVDGEEEVDMNDELKQTEFVLKAMEMLNNKIARLQKENEEMKPKADNWDKFLDTNGTYSFTEVSKLISTKANDEGLDIKITSVKLTELLRDLGVLNKTRNKAGYKNLPNKDFEDYFNVSSIDTKHGFNKSQTRVNAKGVAYIYDIVKERQTV